MPAPRKNNLVESDKRVAALLPVNSAGEIVSDAESWEMPVGNRALISAEDDENISPPDPIEQTAVDRVQAFLNDVGNDASAKLIIYRYQKDTRKLAFVDEMAPEEFERTGFKAMSNIWGAGEYEIRLYGRTGETGAFGVRSRVRVTLDPPRPSLTSIPAGQSELAQVLDRMSQQQEAMLRAITERPAPPDPMAQMGTMLAMMKTMREAMGLDQPQAPAKSQLSEIVAAMRELREVSEEINPKPEAEGPMAMVTKMLPMIQEAMAQRAQAPQQTAPSAHIQQPSLPAPQSEPSLPAPQSEPEMNPITMLTLKAHLAQLTKLAVEKAPFEQGAELVYEKLPDEFIELLAAEQWFDLLKMAAPEMEPHKEWLVQVRENVLQMLHEDAAELDSNPAGLSTAPVSD